MEVSFTERHLSAFSAASFDFSPFHLSKEYARTTSAGEQVVHGILGFLSCIPEVSVPTHMVPSELRIDFKSPLLLGLRYAVRIEPQDCRGVRIMLLDGSTPVIRARLQFCPGDPQTIALQESGAAPRRDARRLSAAELEALPRSRGTYAPGRNSYDELLSLLGICAGNWGDAFLFALLCSSYLTGMEQPGESATYSGLRLKLFSACRRVPFDFEIASESYDNRFAFLSSRFVLSCDSQAWATGEISAAARPARDTSAPSANESSTGSFQGNVALIIGASRGLGAAMALDIVAAGGTVIGVYSRSDKDAADLAEAARRLPGHLTMERGNASDLDWCLALKDRVQAEFGQLNLLVCNAAPPIHPLRIEGNCYRRIREYLDCGFDLVGVPLSSFLELLALSHGRVLVISSSAVEKPPALWPHYVALKAAVEGFVGTAAVAYPKVTFCIARPGRILTDVSDAPMSRLDAEPAATVARRVLASVIALDIAPGLHIAH